MCNIAIAPQFCIRDHRILLDKYLDILHNNIYIYIIIKPFNIIYVGISQYIVNYMI